MKFNRDTANANQLFCIYPQLFGRNEARGARFQGWTNTILIGFVGRRDDLGIIVDFVA